MVSKRQLWVCLTAAVFCAATALMVFVAIYPQRREVQPLIFLGHTNPDPSFFVQMSVFAYPPNRSFSAPVIFEKRTTEKMLLRALDGTTDEVLGIFIDATNNSFNVTKSFYGGEFVLLRTNFYFVGIGPAKVKIPIARTTEFAVKAPAQHLLLPSVFQYMPKEVPPLPPSLPRK